jgi:hypothetical protein
MEEFFRDSQKKRKNHISASEERKTRKRKRKKHTRNNLNDTSTPLLHGLADEHVPVLDDLIFLPEDHFYGEVDVGDVQELDLADHDVPGVGGSEASVLGDDFGCSRNRR